MSIHGIYLRDKVGKCVAVNGGGPEARSGLLLDVQRDYLALNTKEEGVIYYNLKHIKSLTVIKQSICDKLDTVTPPFIKEFNFTRLLFRLINQTIQINRGGPDKLIGLLTDVTSSHLTVVVGGENITVPIFHIKNVSVVVPKKVEKDIKKEKKDIIKKKKTKKSMKFKK
ncbi:spore coat protein B [Caldalkalibacillus uzonensis]|uniref:Spore coat protein B n=1 Tax=Caldalkalibacillus uzonensis TaxID=353224 RepID=A0ABU0CXN5_9BACI|nr:hypothetical protein [Caldalkalibacillus uzonensis]MDQ0340487.1 spore coat protein B [Caldalkalibacillus uzonensis]